MSRSGSGGNISGDSLVGIGNEQRANVQMIRQLIDAGYHHVEILRCHDNQQQLHERHCICQLTDKCRLKERIQRHEHEGDQDGIKFARLHTTYTLDDQYRRNEGKRKNDSGQN